jgi:ABC-type transport system involved in multi-copper enzyme maturation permease subunit
MDLYAAGQPMSKNHPMIVLLKKDWGLNRVPIYGGLVLVASPYLLVALFATIAKGPDRYRAVSDSVTLAVVLADILTILIAAVFGGAAFAQERRERSTDFLAMMPVSRARVLISKLVVATLVLAALWGTNCAIYAIADHYGQFPPSNVSLPYTLLVPATLLLTFFGVAWLFSSFLNSPAVAACISIGIGCMAVFWPELLPTTLRDKIDISDPLMFSIFITVGMVGLVAGSFHYLRRVEP